MNSKVGYSVLVIDMAHYQEPESERVITGFSTKEEAIAYARNRVRDSLAELRKPDQSPEELRRLWTIFGEDACVPGEDYTASNELDSLMESLETCRRQS
jgi:hypothetical protein